MFSDWPSLPGRAKEGHGEEKERVLAPEYESAVNLAPYHEKSEYKFEIRSALSKSNLAVRRAFLPELHHSSHVHPQAFAPQPNLGRSPAQLQTLFFNRRT